MAYPDFIGIGAQKAGTTWLSHNLQLHPEIWMPSIKELHYFNERTNEPSNPVLRLREKFFGNRTVERRWRRQVKVRSRRHLKKFHKERILWDLKYYFGAPGDEWYASLFEPGLGKVAGEITPAYSTLNRESVARVYNLVPEAKLIFMMRNPIERAWSQAVMWSDKSSKKNLEPAEQKGLYLDFESEGSQWRTDYLRTLENWASFYPEEQIFVGFLEDIHFFPEEFLESIYEFLGVDSSFRPRKLEKKIHSRSVGEIPVDVATSIAHIYLDKTELLSQRFGGYTSFWRYCAKRLIDNTLEQEYIPYPLWESFLWEEWLGSTDESGKAASGKLEPQSNLLSSIQPVSRGG